MFCSNCGNALNKEAQFCHKCGYAVIQNSNINELDISQANVEKPVKKGIAKAVKFILIFLALVIVGSIVREAIKSAWSHSQENIFWKELPASIEKQRAIKAT